MPNLQRPKANVHYETEGTTGPWITLLNGHTRSIRDLATLRKQLVAAGFRTLAVDNRGAGGSTSEEPFTVATMAEDVIAVWDELSLTSTGVFGISLGGLVSQVLAVTQPKRVAALLLCSTAAATSWFASPAPRPLVGNTEADNTAALEGYFSPSFLAKHAVLAKAFVKEMSRSFSDPVKAEGIRQQRAAFAVFDSRTDSSRIQCPTLVLHGAEDRVFPPEAARELAGLIPRAELQLVPSGGHLLLAEQAKTLYETTLGFFQTQLSR